MTCRMFVTFPEQHRSDDINAEPAWIQGYTGTRIVVGVVDDGEIT